MKFRKLTRRPSAAPLGLNIIAFSRPFTLYFVLKMGNLTVFAIFLIFSDFCQGKALRLQQAARTEGTAHILCLGIYF
jgi:hypothetical protein